MPSFWRSHLKRLAPYHARGAPSPLRLLRSGAINTNNGAEQKMKTVHLYLTGLPVETKLAIMAICLILIIIILKIGAKDKS